VRLLDPLSQHELAALYHEHDVAVVPLLRNDRNVVQGCCPLKVLEAMACGTTVIASDLPVVRAMAEDDREALLVRPGSGKAIKDAVLRLVANPELGRRLSAAARARVEECLTWEIAGRRLVHAYADLSAPNPLNTENVT
jgi:glycosyltransferase involved in cell wall biosynthesis